MSNNKVEHGGRIWSTAASLRIPANQIFDFSANINPLGIPESARTAIMGAIDDIRHYPDSDARRFKQVLADYHQKLPDYFLPGNGGIELIYSLCRAGQFEHVLIVTPTFGEYERAVRLAGGAPIFVHADRLKNFEFPIEDVLEHLPKVDACFICTPNNPTGRTVSSVNLERVYNVCEKLGVCLIIDESFHPFVYPMIPSMIEKVVESSHLVVIRSMTKEFALPGIRLGYLASSIKWIERIDQVRDPWSVNLLAQEAGIAVLRDRDYISRTENWLSSVPLIFQEQLSNIEGIHSFESQCNFVLFQLGEKTNPLHFQEFLLKQRVLIRWCNSFSTLGKHYFRTAIRLPDENEKLLTAINEAIQLCAK